MELYHHYKCKQCSKNTVILVGNLREPVKEIQSLKTDHLAVLQFKRNIYSFNFACDNWYKTFYEFEK